VTTFQPNGRKGRPRDPQLAFYRNLFPDWSERTIARYARASKRLRLMNVSYDETCEAIRLACRDNGTIDVARFDRITEFRAIRWCYERGLL
jgi:hypothetical protein